VIQVSYRSGGLASLRLAPAFPLPPDPRFVRALRETCQLAGDWRGRLPPGQWIAQQKIDGVRALWIDGDLETREGFSIGRTDHIRRELRELERAAGERLFIDGEFQVDGTLSATTRHFQQRGRYGDAGTFFAFDVLSHAQWLANASTEPLTARLAHLERLVELTQPKSICLIPSRPVATAVEVMGLAQRMWAAGLEGLILKREDSRYERRRSGAWLKVTRRGAAAGEI